jgi:hypothetical protein
MTSGRLSAFILAGSLAGGALLAWLDGKGFTLAGWLAYAVLLGLSLALIAWIHRTLAGGEAPKLVLALAVGAMALRLVVGLALARGLPEFGYDEKVQDAGYVFWDAFKRDGDAWQRARGDLPLVASFTDPKVSDQYGGMMFVSAATYRYLGAGEHRPMMVIVLTAAASALSVLFIWGFAHVRLGAAVGVAAAVIALVMPEAILLGSSQMREPFLILGLAIALYGYGCASSDRPFRSVPWILGGLAVLLVFSPPSALLGALILGGLALWEGKRRPRIPGWVWWLGAAFVVSGLLLAIRSWAQLEQIRGSLAAVVVQWWQNAGDAWRLGQAASASDQIQVMLDRLPMGARLPFLIGYGLVQPFLPAAIAAPGNALWKTIAILRSLGWFVLFPLLLYGTVAAIRRQGWRSLEAYLGLLVWAAALLASYRAPGYQWDNPRYRTTLLAAQAALAAWAWVSARSTGDPWLGRLYVCVGIASAWVLSWYLGRYADWPSLSLEATLAAALLVDAVYVGVCIIRDRRRAALGRTGKVAGV